jgi:molecular chaperone DnaK
MIEATNQAESAVYTAEKFLRDFNDRLPEDAKKETQDKIDAVRKAEGTNDPAQLKAAVEALTLHIQGLGAKMYEQLAGDAAASNGADGASAPKSDKGEDVVDAEFTEA